MPKGKGYSGGRAASDTNSAAKRKRMRDPERRRGAKRSRGQPGPSSRMASRTY